MESESILFCFAFVNNQNVPSFGLSFFAAKDVEVWFRFGRKRDSELLCAEKWRQRQKEKIMKDIGRYWYGNVENETGRFRRRKKHK